MTNNASICNEGDAKLPYRISRFLVSTVSILLIKSFFLLPARIIRNVIRFAADSASKRLTGIVFPDFKSIYSGIVGSDLEPESESLLSINSEAVYSGRIIHVKEFLRFDAKDGCLKSNSGDCIYIENSLGANLSDWETRLKIEQKFNLFLETNIIPSVNNIIETGKTNSDNNLNLNIALAHEQTHWLLLRGTSISNVIEAISWRKRLDLMLITEKIHQQCGLLRRFDLNYFLREKDEVIKKIDSFASDTYNCFLFGDIISHQYFLNYLFPSILKVIIEPVTWALIERSVEPSWEHSIRENYFDVYFETDDSKIATQIYNYCLNFLKDEGSNRSVLIDLVNKSLDPPMQELEKTNFERSRLLKLLTDRFFDSLSGKTISSSGFEEKRFGNAIGYAAFHSYSDGRTMNNVQKLDLNFVDMFIGVIEREKLVLNKIRTISSLVTDLGIRKSNDRPTIFINWDVPNEPFFLRYDCITQLAGNGFSESLIGHMNLITIGKPLNRIDDFVSEFPTTLDTSLWLLRLLGDYDNMDLLRSFFEENLRASDKSFFNTEFIKGLIALRGEIGISYSDLAEHAEESYYLKKFMRFWYSYLLLGGVHVLDLKLQHGMWA